MPTRVHTHLQVLAARRLLVKSFQGVCHTGGKGQTTFERLRPDIEFRIICILRHNVVQIQIYLILLSLLRNVRN